MVDSKVTNTNAPYLPLVPELFHGKDHLFYQAGSRSGACIIEQIKIVNLELIETPMTKSKYTSLHMIKVYICSRWIFVDKKISSRGTKGNALAMYK
jgi:hypothetical protein